jgi:hypothetical protein
LRTPQSAPGAPDRGAQGGEQPTDEALEIAKHKASQMKERARAEAAAAGQQVRDAAEDVKREARDVAEQTKQQMRQMAARQKQAAAGQVSGFAQALKGASSDLEDRGQQFAARWTEQAADGLARASDALERHDLDDLVAGVEDFARRQPIAFLGGAALAGFGLARLMKSSAERRRGTGPDAGAFQTHAGTLPGGAMPGSSPGGAEATRFAGPTSRPGIGAAGTTSGFGPGRDPKGEGK